MKKALSILLALAIGLSFVVCAAAKEAPFKEPGASKFKDFVPAQAAPSTQSLTFTLPIVTGITAVWDGDTEKLFNFWYGPYFGPDNVTITVSFAEGEPEELTHWSDYGYDWFWEVFYEYDDETGKVTFYYWDSNLREAYIDTLRWGDDWNWDDLYTSLPQAEIMVPANLREEYLKNLPKAALKLDESQTVPKGEYTIYTFTPAKDSLYYFCSTNNRNCDPYAYLYDANFGYINGNDDRVDWNFGFIASLQAGKTYYLVVSGYYSEDSGSFDVGVEMLSTPGVFGWLGVLLKFCWFRDYLIIYGNVFYFFDSENSWKVNLRYNIQQLMNYYQYR